MYEIFGQNPRRSIFERFHLFMNLRNSKRRLKIECLRYYSNFGYQNSLMLCLCVRLLGKIREVQFLSLFFNFALRNSKRRLKIECLWYCSNFGFQNSLILCWCVKLLGKIWGVQFWKGFTSSWTAATCFSMLFLIENWMSLILLKLWLPEEFNVMLMCETFGQDPWGSIFEFPF